MSVELWIVLLLIASGLSALIGFLIARRSGPNQAKVDALEAALDEAKQQAEGVQANVNEHFEQSAVLFGRLANDYREFLDHFSTSAQSLGLSESRARELIEQGFQPVLTHDSVPEAPFADEDQEQQEIVDAGGVTADEPESEPRVAAHAEPEEPEVEPPLIDDIVVLEAEAVEATEVETTEAEATEEALEPTGSDVVVDMPEPEPKGRTDPDIKQANP